MFREYIEWSKRNGVELISLRLDPLFGGPNPAAGTDFEWIDLVASSFEKSGQAWKKWLQTEEGQRLNAKWQATADCQVTVNPMFSMLVDPQVIALDERVITFRWCTPLEGVTIDQPIAKNNAIREQRTADSPIGAWNVVFPGLGNRNAPGRFLHMLSFASPEELMAFQNHLANHEGWRGLARARGISKHRRNLYGADRLCRDGSKSPLICIRPDRDRGQPTRPSDSHWMTPSIS